MTRLRDLLASLIALVVLSPVLLVIAICVRCDSAGAVIFRQERVGRNGRAFTIHKFRTMRSDASGLAVTTAADGRITRVGTVLRATKLDELPQLFDVVVGSMALVGPRPEVAKYVDLWPAELRATILSVRPGITDPATAILRHEATLLASAEDPERTYISVLLPFKAQAYADYVTSRTFWGDIAILIRTFVAIAMPDRGSDAATMARLSSQGTEPKPPPEGRQSASGA